MVNKSISFNIKLLALPKYIYIYMAIVLYTHRNENATLYMRLCPKGHANHSEPLKQNIMTQNNGIYCY